MPIEPTSRDKLPVHRPLRRANIAGAVMMISEANIENHDDADQVDTLRVDCCND
jgi:hypothetical protein